jgi:hypothetical protein
MNKFYNRKRSIQLPFLREAYQYCGSLEILDLILRIENFKSYNNHTHHLFNDKTSYDLIEYYIRIFKRTKV